MNGRPRVSIGLPVFNGERFVAEAIDSILAQTFTDFELIVSDNASTDRTEEICRQYAEKDERIRYVRNRENYGAAFNFNQTFHLSSGTGRTMAPPSTSTRLSTSPRAATSSGWRTTIC